MPLLEVLQETAATRQGIIDAASASSSSELKRILERFFELLDEYMKDAEGLTIQELSALSTFDDLSELLVDAGMGDLVDGLRESIKEASAATATGLRAAGFTAGQLTLDEGALTALVNFKLEQVAQDIAAPIARQIQEAWIDSTFTGKSIREAMAEVGALLTEKTPGQAETVVSTAFNAIDRTITGGGVAPSEDDSIVYLYVGPSPDDGDRITRKTCIHIVNKWLTREEINSLDNGQLPNVFVNGGGYNCRHSWAPLKKTIAEKNGIDPATASDLKAFNDAGQR